MVPSEHHRHPDLCQVNARSGHVDAIVSEQHKKGAFRVQLRLLPRSRSVEHQHDLACHASLSEQLLRVSCLGKRKSLCD